MSFPGDDDIERRQRAEADRKRLREEIEEHNREIERKETHERDKRLTDNLNRGPSASLSDRPSKAAVIAIELVRWRSLLLWAALGAIFYFTPLTEIAWWRPCILSQVVLAMPLAVLVITSPTARPFAVVGFVLLAGSSALLTWLYGPTFLRLPPLPLPTSGLHRIDEALSECQKSSGKQSDGAASCFQTAATALETEISRLDNEALRQLNDGPRGKPAFLSQRQEWSAQRSAALARFEKTQSRNPSRKLSIARERWRTLRERAEFLAVRALAYLDQHPMESRVPSGK